MVRSVFSWVWKGATGVILALQATYGQQQATFTQYMFNGLALNPAYAGSQESLSLTALARKQWTGFAGSPSTQTFAIHSPIRSHRIALGALLINDRIGIVQQTGAHACYAYRIVMDRATLSMGLQAGFTSYRADPNQLSIKQPGDPSFAPGDFNRVLPGFGAGLYYYTERFYLGTSVPQIVNQSNRGNRDEPDLQPARHYLLTSGYVLDLSPSLKLKPSLLLKVVEGAPVQVDLNAHLLLREVLWVGLSYRTFESLDALLQVQLSDQFRLGYAYDFVLSTRSAGVRTGSHELMLNYQFTFHRAKAVTPRYF